MPHCYSLFLATAVVVCIAPCKALAATPSFSFTDAQFVTTWNKQNRGGEGMTIARLAPAEGNARKIVFDTAGFYTPRGKMAALGIVDANTPMALSGRVFVDPATRKVTRIELTGVRSDFLNLSLHGGNIVSLLRYFDPSLSSPRGSSIANDTLGAMRGDDDPRCGQSLTTTIGKARIAHLVRPSSVSTIVFTQATPK